MINKKKKLDKDPYSELGDYLTNVGTREHPVARELREYVESIRFGHMQVTAPQGQFLNFIIKLLGSKNILEIGTFKGYSSLCMALALPKHGKLTTIDFKTDHFDEAAKWWNKANIQDKIQTVHGDGLETLKNKASTNKNYDLIFIDADKKNYDKYLEPALKCLTQDGLLIFDNTLWYGNVADEDNKSPETISIKTLNQLIQGDDRIEMCLMPFADGMTLIKKNPDTSASKA